MSGLTSEPFGILGKRIKQDVHNRDLDAKIIITSHNSRPGLGKTTLAIRMARDFDANSWTAEEKAFMEAANYHGAYDKQPSGSVLLFDEVEGEADNRRSMSNKNVELSQAWAQNRYRNMITICTLPSVSMLDKRLLEMSDYWINVIDRGIAHPYRILVNDFNGKVIRNRIDENATIYYDDLPDGDPDYEYLTEMKHQRRTSDDQHYYSEDEHEKRLEEEVEDALMEYRNQWFRAAYHNLNIYPKDISDLQFVDVSRTRIQQIVKENSD